MGISHSSTSKPHLQWKIAPVKVRDGGAQSPTRVGAYSQAQDKLTALLGRRLIRSLSAFSLAKEDQVNKNA